MEVIANKKRKDAYGTCINKDNIKQIKVSFADLLDKTRKKLDEASGKIADATSRYQKIDNLLGKADSYSLELPQEIPKLPDENEENE